MGHMSITPLFPNALESQKPAQEAFEREVAARFGLVPNFFRSAPDAPFVVHELWQFARAAYLDTPIPTLFKERLFVYLSRFCEVRYCITRHCGFLLGLGRAAGDPGAQAMTITPVLRQHGELARLLLEDKEAGHCDMGTRLFEELESLRDLTERQELEKAKHALELKDRQKDLLLKEVDHRIKNSLQIVSSLLHLQARTAGASQSQLQNAAARIAAIAAVHRQLHKSDYVGSVQLDAYLTDLCQEIATASGSPDRPCTLTVDAVPLTVDNDIAVPLALIVNELLTNAIRHSQPAGEDRTVHVVVSSRSDDFSVSVSDPGGGPDPAQTTFGLGTRLIEALTRQISGTITRQSLGGSYTVTVTAPLVHRNS